jgi:hypothetical protein
MAAGYPTRAARETFRFDACRGHVTEATSSPPAARGHPATSPDVRCAPSWALLTACPRRSGILPALAPTARLSWLGWPLATLLVGAECRWRNPAPIRVCRTVAEGIDPVAFPRSPGWKPGDTGHENHPANHAARLRRIPTVRTRSAWCPRRPATRCPPASAGGFLWECQARRAGLWDGQMMFGFRADSPQIRPWGGAVHSLRIV